MHELLFLKGRYIDDIHHCSLKSYSFFLKKNTMKPLLTLLLYTVLISSLSNAQCVIFKGYSNEAFGAAYHDKDNPMVPISELEKKAKAICERRTVSCEHYYTDNTEGWWAIVVGTLPDGKNFLQAVKGMGSKAEAEDRVRNLYRQAGGMDEDYTRVDSWYVLGPDKK